MKSPDAFRFQNLNLYRMRRLSQALGSLAEQALARDQEIRLHDWRILSMVHQQPGITAAKAGPAVLLNKMQASRAITHLSSLGLLKVGASEDDGRASPLHLTSKGRRVLDATTRRMAALEIWALEGLTKEELVELSRLLGKIERRALASVAVSPSELDVLYESKSGQNRSDYLFAMPADEYEAPKP